MLYVVLARNEFGLRDAWYVHGDDVAEAMEKASAIMASVGICPETVTVLPAKESRTVPYMFPKDPDTDAELVLDFLRGYIRPVLLDYPAFCDLTEGGGYETEVCAETTTRILQFPTAETVEQGEE